MKERAMQIPRNMLYTLYAGILLVIGSETGAAEPQAAAAAEPSHGLAENALVSVNGQEVTREVFSLYVQERHKANPGGQISPQQQSAALNELINLYLLAETAEQKALTERVDVQAALTLQRRQLLARVAMADFVGSYTPDEAEVKRLYEEQVGTESGKEYKARHILVKTEDEAKEAIAALDGGADFAELAKERSTGPSGPSGGDLGWFAPKQMVKPFSDAVAGLEKGSYSKEPVQTQFGWHVILLEDEREATPPSLDDMRPKLEAQIKQDALREYLGGLQKTAAIVINENNLTPAGGTGDAAAQAAGTEAPAAK